MVERQHGAVRPNDLAVEIIAERVPRLPQRMIGMLIVRLGPKQPGEALTRYAAIAGCPKHSEQGEPRGAESRRGGSVVGFEAEPTEGDEAQHSTCDFADPPAD